MMASRKREVSVTWLRMVSLSLLLTTTSLASDLVPANSIAAQNQATAVSPATKQTNGFDSAAAAVAKTGIPTSTLSTVIVTVKPTPSSPSTSPLFPDPNGPIHDSPAIAAPAFSPTQTHLVAAQASDPSQSIGGEGGSPFDTDPDPEDGSSDPTVHPFPLSGGHGPVIPSSNPALIFPLASASLPLTTGVFNPPLSPIQTIYVTRDDHGAASTVTAYINTATSIKPLETGLAGDRDSTALMTSMMSRTTTYLTVSPSRSFTTITAAASAGTGVGSSGAGVIGNSTTKPNLVKNGGADGGGSRAGGLETRLLMIIGGIGAGLLAGLTF